jgi:hypothetical protein
MVILNPAIWFALLVLLSTSTKSMPFGLTLAAPRLTSADSAV